MDILSLVQTYQQELERSQAELNQLVDTLLSRDQNLLIDCLSVCETAKEYNINLLKIDSIDKTFEEIQSSIEFIDKLKKFQHKISKPLNKDPKQALEKYEKNLKTFEKFPIVQSSLIEELRTLLEKQHKEVIFIINSAISQQFSKTYKNFFVFNEFWESQKLLERLGHWNETEYCVMIAGFYKDNFNKRFKSKVLVGKSVLTARKVECANFAEKIESFLEFFQFFQEFFKSSEGLRNEFAGIIEEITKKQAEKCIDDDLIKNETILKLKPCERILNSNGFSLDLIKIIENSKDYLLNSWKHSVLTQTRDFFTSPYTTQHPTLTCLITKNLQRFLDLVLSVFSQPQALDYEKFFYLSTIREALILFQALRTLNFQNDPKFLAFLISDTEYLLVKLSEFSVFKEKYPEHLHYLLDFSDISAVLSAEILPYYGRIVEIYQNDIKKKCEPFDFSQFDENFPQQELVLMRILNHIRKSEVKTVLVAETHCKLLGQIIDTLIEETVDRILLMKNIFIKDFQLIKQFFDKIFDVRDVFEGQNPTKFCVQWDKLEALLEIIEGRLVDIIAAYQRNRYKNLFTLKQLRRLIKALFEDNDKRKNALKVII